MVYCRDVNVFSYVCVHGADGSPILDVFWPRDLLGADLEHARIISWGYDSDITNMFSSSSQDTIVGHAETLLADIDAMRCDSEVSSLISGACKP